MKKTVSVSLGKCNLILEEEAYHTLRRFLSKYSRDLSGTENAGAAEEIVEEVEMRMADLLREKLHGREVVDQTMVKDVISEMGFTVPEQTVRREQGPSRPHKLFRDKDHKVLGGVCSGLALYLDADVVIIKVLFVLAAIFGLAGVWIYLACWLIIPVAKTPVDKCEMHGEPATPENIEKYSLS